MEEKQNNNKLIVIIIICVVLVIGVILTLVLLTKKQKQDPIDEPKEPEFTQCEKDVDKKFQTDISNWTHNGINYDFDQEGNRVNNSSSIKETHQIDGGFEVTNMSIISKKCEETKVHITFTFTNNSGNDIEFGTINFYFEPSKTPEGQNEIAGASMDIKNLKNGETKEFTTTSRTRIIDASNYKATFIDSSQMDG